jgi:hypothetical protein
MGSCGSACSRRLGHYRGLEWNEKDQKYIENPELGILVDIDVRSAIWYIHPVFFC